MSQQKKVTGVILAGGLARRMSNSDKGLVLFHGKPMASYAIAAIEPLVESILVNANRNQVAYEQFGWPVVADQNANFEGPLAGILTAMIHSEAEVLLVMPCDSPLFKTENLQKLLTAQEKYDADVAVAFDGERLHPVFLAIKSTLKSSLQDYLASGQRKIDLWLAQHKMVKVDFSDAPDVFINVNTFTELSALEGGVND